MFLAIFWPKIPTLWPKKQNFDFNMIGSIYMFYGARNPLVYFKIRQNYQKPRFMPKNGQT